MNKNIAVLLGLFFLGTVHSQGIYKWTDEKGKIHYGDALGAPNSGAKTSIKGAAPPDTGNLQQCLEMARLMANKQSTNPSEIRADSKNLLDLCPGTAYECSTYTEMPEKNNCRAVALSGPIMKNSTYKR